jgi:hypothetical protein
LSMIEGDGGTYIGLFQGRPGEGNTAHNQLYKSG